MKYGCMGKLEQAEIIRKAGFHCLELDLQELMKLDEAQFRQARSSLLSSGLEFPVCSWILPVDLDMTSAEFDRYDWYDYLSRGADRCAELGVHIWPFGTGRGRSFKPQNGDVKSQKARVAEFLSFIDRIIFSRKIYSAIEPLGPANSNYISTLKEADELRRCIGSPSIKLMCDLRHMVWSHDDYSNISAFAENIIHCHIDCPLGTLRVLPRKNDGFNYGPYIEQICKLPCNRLAFEAIHAENTLDSLTDALKYISSVCNRFL